MRLNLEVGWRLVCKKTEIGHGDWESWVTDNKSVLGFTDRTARRLMRAANKLVGGKTGVDARFDGIEEIEEIVDEAGEVGAIEFSQGVWGNQPDKLAFGTGENEWFTPPEYIEKAREVLGEIELEPATHKKAQESVKAKRFFTKSDDGLSKKWKGKVWLNPPHLDAARRFFGRP